MTVPYRHVADYTDLTVDEVAELGSFTQVAMSTMRAVAGPHGFNIGMNQGVVAGAGIAAHLHQHVVPRWAATRTSSRSWPTRAYCPNFCRTRGGC